MMSQPDDFSARIRRIAQLLTYDQDVSEFSPLDVRAAQLYMKYLDSGMNDDDATKKVTESMIRLSIRSILIEKRIRETDITGGKKTKFGSEHHVRDLEKRIADLTYWRDKQKRGSEVRATYSRLVSRLKGELSSARRASVPDVETQFTGSPRRGAGSPRRPSNKK